MKYTVINNFVHPLGADLTDADTTMSIGSTAAAELVTASATNKFPLTLALQDSTTKKETTWEVVYVTAADEVAGTVTVERGQDGTTAVAWTAGEDVTVSSRATADMINGVYDYADSAAAQDRAYVLLGGGTASNQSNTVTIGGGTFNDAAESICIGRFASTGGSQSIAIGKDSAASGATSVIIGGGFSSAANVVGIGGGTSLGANTVAVGRSAYGRGTDCTILGYFGIGGVGHDRATSVGARARVNNDEAVSIGFNAHSNIAGGMQVMALSYLPSSPVDHADVLAPNATRRAASRVVVETDDVDLTSGVATFTLNMPSGTMVFVEEFDIVVTGADSPGGSPEITIGPDDTTPAAYLAATIVSKTAVGGRQSHACLEEDGITAIRVAVSTAGTGTTYTAKVVAKGYVMQI